MSIKKLLPLGVSVCTNGFRQETKTLNYVIRLISSASKGTNGSTATSRTNNFTRNGRVLIHTRNLKSSKFHQRSSGYLSDPGNVGKRQSGVNFDTLGSWNNRLGLDVNLKQSIASGKLIPQIDVGTAASASVIGRRKQNEDRVTIDEISPDLILFAIYDGHGGAVSSSSGHFNLLYSLVFNGVVHMRAVNNSSILQDIHVYMIVLCKSSVM